MTGACCEGEREKAYVLNVERGRVSSYIEQCDAKLNHQVTEKIIARELRLC